jgi:Zn-dependent protease
LVLLATAMRGATGWTSFVNGFGQVIGGALDPAGCGAELVRGYRTFADSHGIVPTLGVIFAKIGAFNLLPIPKLAGGLTLIELIRPPRSPSFDRAVERLWHVLIWLVLAMMASWLFAIYTALTR